MNKDYYIIVDIDGTISDDRDRRAKCLSGKKEMWDSYHEAAVNDKPVDDVIRLIYGEIVDIKTYGDNPIILFVTGRNERYRPLTNGWLTANFPASIPYGRLLMRPDGDFSSSPELKVRLLNEYFAGIHGDPTSGWERVRAAFDDQERNLAAFPIWEDNKHLCRLPGDSEYEEVIPSTGVSTADVLKEMADTFRERNKVYGDNYFRVAPVMKTLWPEGVPSGLVTEDRWHLFELLVVKLTRFAAGGLTHTDSIHDAAVYAAMIEADLRRSGKGS